MTYYLAKKNSEILLYSHHHRYFPWYPGLPGKNLLPSVHSYYFLQFTNLSESLFLNTKGQHPFKGYSFCFGNPLPINTTKAWAKSQLDLCYLACIDYFLWNPTVLLIEKFMRLYHVDLIFSPPKLYYSTALPQRYILAHTLAIRTKSYNFLFISTVSPSTLSPLFYLFPKSPSYVL